MLRRQMFRNLLGQTCSCTSSLEVHHKSRFGGTGYDNTQVLCKFCHTQTDDYGDSSIAAAPDFPQDVIEQAKTNRPYCECTNPSCDHQTEANHSICAPFGLGRFFGRQRS